MGGNRDINEERRDLMATKYDDTMFKRLFNNSPLLCIAVS